jgi:hypothetical protein
LFSKLSIVTIAPYSKRKLLLPTGEVRPVVAAAFFIIHFRAVYLQSQSYQPAGLLLIQLIWPFIVFTCFTFYTTTTVCTMC